MKKKLVLIVAILFSYNVSAVKVNHFFIKGAKLYDPCSIEFNIRGVNYAPYNWGYSPNELLFSEIALTGANAVRISWYANNSDIQTHNVYTAAKLAIALDACIAEGMLPIIDLHDQTCKNNPDALISLSNFYLQSDAKAVLLNRQDRLIINIANEALSVLWSANSSISQNIYKNTYSTIISNLRNVGYTCPLMIDAPDCGTNSDVLAAVGQDIIKADPLHNIIFSSHTYWNFYANNDLQIVQQKLQTLINSEIPFVIGEVANYQDDSQACQYLLPYQQLLTICKTMGINWLAWSWSKDVCPNRQISTSGRFANLTNYGNDLVNNSVYGLKANSIKSPFLSINTCNSFSDNQLLSSSQSSEVTITNDNKGLYLISSSSSTFFVKLYDIVGQKIFTTILYPYTTEYIVKSSSKGGCILKIDHDNKLIIRKMIF